MSATVAAKQRTDEGCQQPGPPHVERASCQVAVQPGNMSVVSARTAVVVAVCAWAVTPSHAVAQTRTRSCIEAIRWSGDAELVDVTRAALTDAALGSLPEARCEGVEVHIQRRRGAVRISVRRAEQVVRYATSEPSTVPSWIESWLLPDAESPRTPVLGAAPTDAVDRSAGPAEPAVLQDAANDEANDATDPESAPSEVPRDDRAAHEPDAEPSYDDRGRTGAALVAADRAGSTASRRLGLPVLASVRLGGDLDHVAPAWASGELELAIGFGSGGWLSLAAAGAFSTEQSETIRNALRAAARVGYRHRSQSGLLRLGFGAGVVSARAEREYASPDGQILRDDEEIAPFVEVYTGYELALSGYWALSLAVVLRGILPDDAFDGGDLPGEARLPYADPSPLPVIAITLAAGISFGLGDAW